MGIKTILALVVTVILWASAMVAIRFSVAEYHPGSLALLRLLAGSVSISFVIMGRHSQNKFTRKDILFIILLGLLSMSVYQYCLNVGEVTVNAGIASFIIAQIPVLATILASVFLKEKVKSIGWLGLLISIIGVGIIAVGEMENSQFDWGVIYIIISVLSAATYIVMAKFVLKKFSPMHFTAYIIWVGAAGLLVFTPELWHDIHTASTAATLVGIYLGVFPTTIAYLTYNYALKQIPASVSSTALYAIPFVAIIMGWLFLGEIPTWVAISGGLISLFGAVLVSVGVKTS